MTGVLIAVVSICVVVFILQIKVLMVTEELGYEIHKVRNDIAEFRRRSWQEHDFTQDAIARVENGLDVLTKPIEEHVANVVTKMFHDIDEED